MCKFNNLLISFYIFNYSVRFLKIYLNIIKNTLAGSEFFSKKSIVQIHCLSVTTHRRINKTIFIS